MNLRPEILLCPNIPKPLHLVNPRTIFGQEWWDTERRKAYASTNFHCAACGVHKLQAAYHKWLEAHELYEYDYPNGTLTLQEIVPLCHACHNFIHSGRMQALVDKGEMSITKMRHILAHGKSILKDSGLRKPAPPKRIAPWGKWRMIINGQEFEPKFKSKEEWMDYFHPGWDDGFEGEEEFFF